MATRYPRSPTTPLSPLSPRLTGFGEGRSVGTASLYAHRDSTSHLMSKIYPFGPPDPKFQEIVDAHPSAQTICQVTEQACSKKLPKGKVALMVVMLKTIERVGMNANAILEDSTGAASCTIHAKVLRNPQLKPGAILILRQVSVFCPSKKSNHCYLCITPNNIVTIYADVSAASEILVTKLEESVAVMGNTLTQLVELVSAKHSETGKDEDKSMKELLPLQTMHDIFDTEFSEELAGIIVSTVWSELPQDLISRMVESAENHITLKHKSPIPKKLILKRLREFYANRRSTLITKQDTAKRRARRETMKINSLIYNKRQEAVKTAIRCGEIAPEDDEAIIQLKKSVELPPRESMSPIPNSDDEEEIMRRKKRRLENLEEARRVRKMKSEERKRIGFKNMAHSVTQKTDSRRMMLTPLGPSNRSQDINTQSLLDEMNDCLSASDCMYTFQDEDIENRQPYNAEEDPDATQLPPGYGDYESQPIL